MMSSSNQTYKSLEIPKFGEVLDAVNDTMKEMGLPYYLIGANAIALELLKNEVRPQRGTKDIDFAVMVSTWEDYEILIEKLQNKGFEKIRSPWTFIAPLPDRAIIGIFPFGGIEGSDKLLLQYPNYSVLGFMEVLSALTTVEVDENTFLIPQLPGIVALKLISWSDRPEERGDDLPDILWIIENYFDYAWDEIVEKHSDTFPDSEEEFRACLDFPDRAKSRKFCFLQGGFCSLSRRLRRKNPTRQKIKFADCSRLREFQTCS